MMMLSLNAAQLYYFLKQQTSSVLEEKIKKISQLDLLEAFKELIDKNIIEIRKITRSCGLTMKKAFDLFSQFEI